jgi:hypothetical protein
MSRPHLFLLAGLVMMALDCGGGDTPTGPSGGSGSGGGSGGGTPPTGTLTALIDGTPFTAATAGGFVRNGILSLSGAMGTLPAVSTTLSLAANATAGATQSVAAGSGVNATLLVLSGSTGAGWQAVQTVGSGSVTVQTLTATNASGTFTFTMPAANGTATGTKAVTNGVFNIALTQ